MPPTVFISMDEDPPMAYRISRDAALLRRLGVPVATVRVGQRAVGPTFFSDRSSRVPPAVSARVTAALRTLGMLDERGLVTMDPRHTKGPWVSQLLALVPELRGGGMVADHSQVGPRVVCCALWARGGQGRGLAAPRCLPRSARARLPNALSPRQRKHTPATPSSRQVWEELNLAYACHEIIGDFTTAALVWFESG